MGFFSTKKVHHVNTTVTRLIDDPSIASSLQTSVINSLVQNDNQLVENILEGLINGMGLTAHRMYNYAGRSYIYGRPGSYQRSSNHGTAVVTDVIRRIIGSTAEVVYYNFGPLNNLHAGWQALFNTYGYESSSNEIKVLSALKGHPVYLKDMVVVLTPTEMADVSLLGMEQWDTPPNAGYTPSGSLGAYAVHSPIESNALATQSYVRVVYEWVTTVNNAQVINTESLTILFNEPLEDDDFFQVKYSYNGNDGYWTYKEGSGSFPELDSLFTNRELASGGFFPFVYFRLNNTPIGKTHPAYTSSKKMLKLIGLDYDELLGNINSNPDIGSVEQAMLTMAVPASTNNQFEIMYLFDFFSQAEELSDFDLSALSPDQQQAYLSGKSSGLFRRRDKESRPPLFNWTLQDGAFKMTIGCNGVFKTVNTGVVAAVGKYAFEYKTYIYEVPYTETHEDGTTVSGMRSVSAKRHAYKKQITSTLYEEVSVADMKTLYYVWGGMAVAGTDTEEILLVPLDKEITRKYSIPEREILYPRSLHFVFNSHTIEKIKWYQKGIFKVIMFVAAVVIVIITKGAALKAFLALLATMTIEAIVMTLLIALLKYILVTVAIKLFIKAVGVQIALIVALVAMAVGMYRGFNIGGLPGAPWAKDLVSLATNLAQGVGKYVQLQMKELQKDYFAFTEYVKEQTKLLDTANDLLENSSILSPFVIFGESPDDFYNRTVHSGNIGIVGIDAISSYVDTALTLPKLSDTMEYA